MKPLVTKEVRNQRGKLVCRVCERRKVIEIQTKNQVTQIQFKPDGKIEVHNMK